MSRKGASGGRRPARPGRSSASGRGSGAAAKRAVPAKKSAKRTDKVVFDAPRAEEPRTLRLGAVPGATPGRWIDTWQERMPHVRLELVPIPVRGQREALTKGSIHLALVRGPFSTEGMHAIPLYDELPVVIASTDSHLLAADELHPADLAGETLLTSTEDVWDALALPTVPARIPPSATVEEAIATAASGVGIVVAPMSLARLHHRKDVEYRVLRDSPVSPVLLAWPAGATTEDIEAFVGIVRGRTANSSR